MYHSIQDNIWSIKKVDSNMVQRYMSLFGVSELEARLIAMRIDKEDAVQDFLEPKMKNLMPDPFHLKDMDKGVDRFIQAIEGKEKICIFGDYDVDGATSSALIKKAMKKINVDVDIYIPDRLKEGYGPNSTAIARLKDKGTGLIVTVDCGSMSHDPIEKASELGVDVIIIDHHICAEKLPTAKAIINPNRLDETSEYKYLAAVGVSFLFIVAVMSRLKKNSFFQEIEEPKLMDLLDIVALGTVCDVMPLKGLNRAFVKQGLKIMAQRQNIGLNALCDVAHIDQIPTCYHLGYVLGPRINAGGRVGESYLGSALLSCDSKIEAEKLAAKLDEFNIHRRSIESNIVDEAINMASMQENNSYIMVYGDWHPGVIGVVAGKLKELYQKPIIVGSLIDGLCKASCRSVYGVDMGSTLAEAKIQGLVTEGGGHAMAAGFTAKSDKLEELKKFLGEKFSGYIDVIEKGKMKEYDIDLVSDALSIDLHKKISNLAPFGAGNREPLVKIDDLFVLKSYLVGEKHISCMLAPAKGGYKGKAIYAISFNSIGTPLEQVLLAKSSNNISIIGQVKEYHKHGTSFPQIIISDVVVA